MVAIRVATAVVLLLSLTRVKALQKFAPSQQFTPSVSLEMFERSLWSGMDVIDEANFLEEEADVSDGPKSRKLGLQILGLQDTGTNLLYSMLRQNFPSQLTFYAGKGNSWSDRGLWKHVNLFQKWSNEPEKFQPIRDGGVVAIAMVREPLSWLQSIRKAPYELKECTSGDDWLQRACKHPIPAGYPDVEPDDAPTNLERIRRVVPPVEYASLGEVWNQWNANYGNLTAVGFKDGLVVTYEELVLRPKQVMRRIADRFGLNEPRSITLKEDAAKTHGDSLCRGEAIHKIAQRTYLPLFQHGQRWQACTALGKELMHQYRYRTCDCCRAGDKSAISPPMDSVHQAQLSVAELDAQSRLSE